MTVELWTSLGGWWAAGIATLLFCVLLFSRSARAEYGLKERDQMWLIVMLFGWIPLGIIALVMEGAWTLWMGP